MIDPISIAIGLGCGIAGLVAGAVAARAGRKQLPGPTTAPGEVELEVKLFAHPEQALLQLKRDLDLLDDSDRLELRVHVQIANGWQATAKLKKNHHFGPFYGSPDDVMDGICASLMDDDSPFIRHSHMQRQGDKSHPLIRGWGKRSHTKLGWHDSDSPLYLTVTGKVMRGAPAPAQQTLTKEDADYLEARREVDELSDRHEARISHTKVIS